MPTCEARQYSDQMVCERCGLTWDVNDWNEPACLLQPVSYKTESLHVVPKAAVDRVFEEIAKHYGETPFLRRMRGIAYHATFLAERTIIIEGDKP